MTSNAPRTTGAGWLGVAWATARVELQRWRRQRVAVASALLLPIAMAALISVALGDDLSEYSTTFALVDRDRGAAGDAFADEVLGDPAVREVADVRRAADRREAQQLVDDGEVGAAIVLPDGLTETLADQDGPRIAVLGDDDEPIAGDLATLLVNQFEVRGQATALAAARSGDQPAGPWPLEVNVTTPTGGAQVDAATHYGPAFGLFFVLVTLGFTASRLVADRQRGVVERIAAGPVSPSAVLAGRAAAGMAIAGVSVATLALTMQLLFGRSWGPTLPVVVLTVAVVVAMGGVAAVIAALARSAEQAQALSVGVAFLFALASGSFAPPGAAVRPSFAELSPTTHALDAYATLATEQAGLGAVGSPVAVLVAFGVAGVVLTPLLMRRLA